MDGGLGIKTLIFTYNELLDPRGSNQERVLELLEELGLESWQVVFEKSDQVYCKEERSQVQHYLEEYREELQGTRVIVDAGNSWKFAKIKGENEAEQVLAEVAERVLVLPSIQHGKLSVCDNKLNAVAKARWRSERTNTDIVYDTLYLIKCLDEVEQSSITSWWKENFMMEEEDLTLAKVSEHLRKGVEIRS